MRQAKLAIGFKSNPTYKIKDQLEIFFVMVFEKTHRNKFVDQREQADRRGDHRRSGRQE